MEEYEQHIQIKVEFNATSPQTQTNRYLSGLIYRMSSKIIRQVTHSCVVSAAIATRLTLVGGHRLCTFGEATLHGVCFLRACTEFHGLVDDLLRVPVFSHYAAA